MKSIALVTVIENNEDNINNSLGTQRLYEDEAILCFENYRKNGGDLKDIPIYAICVTKATISEKYKDKLKNLDVTYIEEYHPVSETFEIGFFNVPIAMAWAEKNLKEEILWHIDLDMNLIKPLPIELFNIKDKDVICGQYDEESMKSQRDSIWSSIPFDTGFTISNRSSGFYQEYASQMLSLLVDNTYAGRIYDLEEFLIDRMYNDPAFNKGYNIIPINKYQIGEGYPSVSTFTDTELSTVYFWHEHIIHDKYYDKIREKIQFSKRIRNG